MQTYRAELECAIARGRERPAKRRAVRRIPLETIQHDRNHIAAVMDPRNVVVDHYEAVSNENEEQGWFPFRVAKNITVAGGARRPVVIFLHPTGSSRDYHAQWEIKYLNKGYIAVDLDMRYHGKRVDPNLEYQEAIVEAWKSGESGRPFLLDNCLVDFLVNEREDVDPARIGVTGMSLGGMHSWMLAAVDERIACCAPIAGVQYFKYAIDNYVYHERVNSIPNVFRVAARELQGCGVEDQAFPECVEAGTVQEVWNRILPGMLEYYDADKSLAMIAPRPLLIVSGVSDMRCPVQGIRLALKSAESAYGEQGVPQNVKLYVDMKAGHELTRAMMEQVECWMDLHLLQPVS
eukprot:jgi/Picsp_1/2861/NSC_01086-R1_esterase lipase domain-containing protein